MTHLSSLIWLLGTAFAGIGTLQNMGKLRYARQVNDKAEIEKFTVALYWSSMAFVASAAAFLQSTHAAILTETIRENKICISQLQPKYQNHGATANWNDFAQKVR